MEKVLITPEMAKEMIERSNINHCKRRLTAYIDSLADVMRRGEWKSNAMPVITDETGRVLDGFSVLLAVLKADMPIEMKVCTTEDLNIHGFDPCAACVSEHEDFEDFEDDEDDEDDFEEDEDYDEEENAKVTVTLTNEVNHMLTYRVGDTGYYIDVESVRDVDDDGDPITNIEVWLWKNTVGIKMFVYSDSYYGDDAEDYEAAMDNVMDALTEDLNDFIEDYENSDFYPEE